MKIYSLSNLNIYLIISFIFIFFSNNLLTYDQSIIYGARDGTDYFLIAQNFPELSNETLQYHKVWRFIIPASIGLISKLFNLDLYFLFRVFIIIFSILSLIIFLKIIKSFKLNDFQIFFLMSFLIFNPYLFRYFIACPTMINDLIFIFGILLLIFGILKSDKLALYSGFLFTLITRQNSIFIFIGIVITKLIYKSQSKFKINDLFLFSLMFLFTFLLNSYFADYVTDYNETYSFNERFAIFNFNYSIIDFLIYNIFPLIILLPLLVYVYFEYDKFKGIKLKSEIYVFIVLITFFTFSIAYVGGPNITGKNLIRLINLVYPLLILIFVYLYNFKDSKINSSKFFVYLFFFVTWSLHPTFSKINIFKFLIT